MPPPPSEQPAAPPPEPVAWRLWAHLCRLWLIWLLIALCTGIEATLWLADSGVIDIPRLRLTVYEYAGFWPGLMGSWRANYTLQPWLMFMTYAFLHSGPSHLFVNMVALWSLGLFVHRHFRPSGFAILYLSAVIGGGLGYGLLTLIPQPMVGASGGIFGLAGALLALEHADRTQASESRWPVAVWVAALLLLSTLHWWMSGGLLAWQAHLGGFLFGWGTARLLYTPKRR